MAGALRKTMIYLGLAGDEEQYDAYDGDEQFEDDDLDRDDERADRRDHAERADRRGEVESLAERRAAAAVTPISRGQVTRVVPSQARGDLRRISTIHPKTYNEAKVIGEAFRSGTPVIMNLGEMDDPDAKRLVDFAAGLVFGLHGAIERVTNKVFLLSPATVEVTPAEKIRDTADRGLFNQS